MSASILLQGKLERAPERRTSRNGTVFSMTTLRVSAGTELQFWRVFVFSESAQDELSRMAEGDAIAVQGTPKFELYRPDNGEARVSLSLTADHVLALRQPPRERKPRPPKEPPAKPVDTRPRNERWAGSGVDEFHDEMPF